MLQCYLSAEQASEQTIAIVPVMADQLEQYLDSKSKAHADWVKATGFTGAARQLCHMPGEAGQLETILLGLGAELDFDIIAFVPHKLHEGNYHFDLQYQTLSSDDQQMLYLSWGLGCYRFEAYKECKGELPRLRLPDEIDRESLERWLSSISLGRDLINTPCCDMGPADLEEAVKHVAAECDAKVTVIVGEDLVTQNYPAIYAVGKGAQIPPRLIDLTWGAADAPKITLVGKGVCFDTGGLNLKPRMGMRSMKKDMGGAAAVLALSRMIMLEQWPVRLRLLIPAVENAIDNKSYRPDDVVQTRAGITVEIDNTDAEGRMVLSDALFEACSESPDYVVDFATLTGARNVALGPDICAVFSNHHELAANIQNASWKEHDPLWQMPLHAKYMESLKSTIADCVNSGPVAGCITAALFLQQFVSKEVKWIHVDTPGSRHNAINGYANGGDVVGIRSILNFLKRQVETPQKQ